MAEAAVHHEYKASRTWWGCKYFRHAMTENRLQSFEHDFFQHNLRNLIESNIPQLTTNLSTILSTLFTVMKYHRENHSDGNDLCPSCLCLVWSFLSEDFHGILEGIIQHAKKEEYKWEQVPDPHKNFKDLIPDGAFISLLKEYSEGLFGSSCCDVERDTHSKSARETPPPQTEIKAHQQQEQPKEEFKSDLDLSASHLNQDEIDHLSESQSSSSSLAPSLSSPSDSLSEQRFQSAFHPNPPSLLLTHIKNKKLLNQDRAYLQKSWNSWVDFAFDQHETPRKFKFGNIDVIQPYGQNSISISFFERPKKTLLSFFARRLEKNRSCRIKVFSRKRASTSGKSFQTRTSPPRTPHQRSPLSQMRRQSSYTPPNQTNSRFTPTNSFQYTFSPLQNHQPKVFHHHNHNTSSGNADIRSRQSFTPQAKYVTQEQFVQIQSQLNYLTSFLTGCPCAPNATSF